jgi:hypothetical protein
MPIAYTSAKTLLVSQATALAADATSAGLTSLASALTNLSLEISGATVTEAEFFGGTNAVINGAPPVTTYYAVGSAAAVWAGILNAASQTIISHNSNIVATDTTAISAALGGDSTTILGLLGSLIQAIENVEKHQQKIRELAEGPGIRTVGPYEWIGIMSIYRLYIEQGSLLDLTDEVTPEQAELAKSKFEDYLNKIRELPKLF